MTLVELERDFLAVVKSKWGHDLPTLGPAPDDGALQRCESKIGVRFPTELRELYSGADDGFFLGFKILFLADIPSYQRDLKEYIDEAEVHDLYRPGQTERGDPPPGEFVAFSAENHAIWSCDVTGPSVGAIRAFVPAHDVSWSFIAPSLKVMGECMIDLATNGLLDFAIAVHLDNMPYHATIPGSPDEPPGLQPALERHGVTGALFGTYEGPTWE